MNTFSGTIGTRTGDRHEAHGTPNQDYSCYALLPDDLGIVAAVSDGAGSAAMARVASRTAAREATKTAWETAARARATTDPATCSQDGMKAAREALEAVARKQGNPLEDYHATLIVAAIINDKAAVAHIGDGASIVKTRGDYKMLTIPARGQYANETFFITMDDYQNMVASNSAEEVTELLLFTDGVQNELIDFRKKKAHPEHLNSLCKIGTAKRRREGDHHREEITTPRIVARHDPRLCQWLEDGTTTHGDDATLLILRAANLPQ